MRSNLAGGCVEELHFLVELLTNVGRDPIYLRESLEEWKKAQHIQPWVVSRKVYVGAFLALHDLFAAVIKSQHILPLLLSCGFPGDKMKTIRENIQNLLEDSIIDEEAAPSEQRLSQIFWDLFDILGSSIMKYKELFLKIKKVPEVVPPEKVVRLRVSEIPEGVRALLGIKNSPLFYRELLRMINNTVIVVTNSQATTGWKELEWVKVESFSIPTRPIFLTVDSIPHVLLVTTFGYEFIPNLLLSTFDLYDEGDYFYSSTIVELMFYFKPNEWAKFIKDVILSAARSAAEGV